MLRLGKYLLVDRINHGGMADIFLAKTFGYEGADRLIAVKCIRPDIASDANFVSMFVDEAKLSVQLDHVNIARTYDLGRIRETYFIAMEHVLGRDLRGVLDRANAMGQQIAYGIVLSIMDQVLEALDYAHRKADLTGVPLRIVHRDVSPHNVLISYSGEVKLIDFGIAKATTQGNTTTGVLRGKYGYMSPEQVRGESIDLRSDIFSTGVLLYELLTGQRLFSGASDMSILDKVRHCEVYPPSVITTDITRDLERVVLRALHPDPGRRFSSASDMRDAIVEVMLRRYGYRSQRDIGAFMAELFEQEIEAEGSQPRAGH
ncbi:MAG: serine/threonine-protein kinase, partial [Myxococcota bacterium]